MRKTLYLKLLIAYLLFALFGFIVVSTFMQQITFEQVRDQKANELYQAASIIAESYGTDLYQKETSLTTLKENLDTLSSLLNATIQIINPSGLVVLDSRSPIRVENPLVIEGFDTTKTNGSFYMIGDFYSQFQDEQLSVAVPITSGYNLKGYVVVHYSVQALNDSMNRYLNIDYVLLGVLILLSLIILIFFSEIVYRPLRKIIVATEQYASGNLHYKFQLDSDDEIGYLAASLSYMANELAKGEDNQKHIVANVSHDFRSPLTSIRGYIEAMRDGTIPPELYDKYLGIVSNEADRLIKLTNSLLTLNNLNTEGMVLDRTDFEINAMIRQTVSTFEGICLEKKVGVELTLTGESYYVNADKTRIQQVLYNLLDNAIKFSPKNSCIKIETTERHSKLFVSVKDKGIGIPKESLGLIFDRFYKTDISRGKDKKGTGLGLSITREIIRAHGENINVISTEGIGSEFIFSLTSSDYEEDEL